MEPSSHHQGFDGGRLAIADRHTNLPLRSKKKAYSNGLPVTEARQSLEGGARSCAKLRIGDLGQTAGCAARPTGQKQDLAGVDIKMSLLSTKYEYSRLDILLRLKKSVTLAFTRATEGFVVDICGRKAADRWQPAYALAARELTACCPVSNTWWPQ